ncbi:MAG: hypothetical protein NT061_12185 [Spirochaetes bacterium]|nr:hypothetical protein [Spirochaetota bacterium]
MEQSWKRIAMLTVSLLCFAAASFAADTKPASITVVGLYSETSDGYINYRKAGTSAWTVVKVGDVIPTTAEFKVNVDRDWLEFVVTGKPAAVYELIGPESGELVKKVSEILKGKPRTVVFPKGSAAKPDAAFKDKLVVTQYLGRQVYVSASGESNDIKYGDALALGGKVKIIAINNTLILMNASGATTDVIGPLNFTIEQVLSNKSLYKFLNVQK